MDFLEEIQLIQDRLLAEREEVERHQQHQERISVVMASEATKDYLLTLCDRSDISRFESALIVCSIDDLTQDEAFEKIRYLRGMVIENNPQKIFLHHVWVHGNPIDRFSETRVKTFIQEMENYG